jgi:hypothetical protein
MSKHSRVNRCDHCQRTVPPGKPLYLHVPPTYMVQLGLDRVKHLCPACNVHLQKINETQEEKRA